MSRKHQKNSRNPRSRPSTNPNPAGDAQSTRGSISLVVARCLLLVCVSIAGYLAWASLSGGAVAGCGPESGCDKVLQSRWAYWFGLPVSVPSLVVYAALLAASFAVANPKSAGPSSRPRWIVAALSITVIVAAVWFVILQAAVIGSFCRFCLAAHASGVVAAILLLRHLGAQRRAGRERLAPAFSPQTILASSVALAALIAGQTLVTKERFRVQKTLPAPVARQPQPEPPPPRVMQIHQGRFQLRLDELPVIGQPNAPRIMISLFDYTCHFCRDMHGLLLQAQRQFSNQLAIVNLPMPLDANCNPLMQRTPSAHQNACEYARLGLAVWRAKRERSAEFDDWVFAPPSPPPVPEVRQHAEQLVGKENLERALADAWVEQQLRMDVEIYQANSREMKSGSMPQLIVGDAIIVGPLDRIEQLNDVLRLHLKL